MAVSLLTLFLAAFALSLASTPVVGFIARRRGRVAAPGPHRWHLSPTALFGGVGIFIGYFAAITIILAHEANRIWLEFPEIRIAPAAGVVVSGCAMFIAGLVDDLIRLRPPTKLALQAFAGALLVSFGVIFAATPWTPVNIFITLFWFVAVTNAMNLLDNMDGVSAGVSVIAALAFGALFSIEGEPALAGLSFGLAGAAAGFLVYNFHPARIFMGDAGSMMLGATFAGLGAVATTHGSDGRPTGIVVGLLILIVPLFDTTLVTLTRTLARRPIAVGGRDHASHRLVALGFSDRGASLALYCLGAVSAGLAMVIAMRGGGVPLWGGILLSISLMLLGAYLARVETYPVEPARAMRLISFLVDDLFYRRRLLEVAVDVAVFGAAYWGAYLIRWDGDIPPVQQAALTSTLGLVAACNALAFVAVGVYRGIWQQVSVADVHRLVRGAFWGGVLSASVVFFFFPTLPFPRSVFILATLLVVLMSFGVRLSFRSLDRMRYRIALPKGAPTLIYGAGRGGDLAVRELFANPQWGLNPIGFIDDDPRKSGVTLHGLRVHYTGNGLDSVLRKSKVKRVLIGTRLLTPERLSAIAARCAEYDVALMELKVEVAEPRLPDLGA